MDKYKLIAFDFDGTILDNSHQIPTSLQQLLRQLKKEDLIFVAASGRSIENIEEILTKSNLIDIFDLYIGENGYRMYDVHTHDNHYSKPLSYQHVQQILSVFEHDDVNYLAYIDGIATFFYDNHFVDFFHQTLHLDYQILDDTKLQDIAISKICMFFNEQDYDHIKSLIASMDQSDYYASQTSPTTFEFQTRETSKWNCLSLYLKKHSLDPRQTFCFGDSENDIEMLKHAGTGVALKNADDHIKEISDDITEYDCHHDGVYHYLKTLYNIKGGE